MAASQPSKLMVSVRTRVDAPIYNNYNMEIRDTKEGELPQYNQTLVQIRQALTQMPKQFRKSIYLWLSLEFGVAKWDSED